MPKKKFKQTKTVKTTDVGDKAINRQYQSRTTTVYRKTPEAGNVEFARPVASVKTTSGKQPGTTKKVEVTKYNKAGIGKTKTYEGKKFDKGVRKGEKLTAGKYMKKSGGKKKRFAKAEVGGLSGVTPKKQKQYASEFNVSFKRGA